MTPPGSGSTTRWRREAEPRAGGDRSSPRSARLRCSPAARPPVAALTLVLLAVCLRAPRRAARPVPLRRAYDRARRLPALAVPVRRGRRAGALGGPDRPVIGPLDVTTEELSGRRAQRAAADRASRSRSPPTRSCSTTTGSSRRRASPGARRSPSRSRRGWSRRSSATPPGCAEAVRGRGVAVAGARGHARLLSPLVAGSLERASNLAEAMEARGFGRPGATRAPGPPWTRARPGRRRAARCAARRGGRLWL